MLVHKVKSYGMGLQEGLFAHTWAHGQVLKAEGMGVGLTPKICAHVYDLGLHNLMTSDAS